MSQPRSNFPRALTTSFLSMALTLGLSACRVEEQVTHETILKPAAAPPLAKPGSPLPSGHPPLGTPAPAPAPAPAGPATAPGTPGMVGDVPPPPPVADGAGLKWTLPKGWTETRAGGMRYATLKPGGDAKVEVSVVVLSGQAGGELANVNRWRGQIGLAPVDEAGLAALRKAVATKAGEVGLYDLTSEGAGVKSRLVAGLLSANGSTWFLKMTGEAATVGAVRDDFGRIVESLSF